MYSYQTHTQMHKSTTQNSLTVLQIHTYHAPKTLLLLLLLLNKMLITTSLVGRKWYEAETEKEN